MLRRRKASAMTKTELSDIAALAIMATKATRVRDTTRPLRWVCQDCGRRNPAVGSPTPVGWPHAGIAGVDHRVFLNTAIKNVTETFSEDRVATETIPTQRKLMRCKLSPKLSPDVANHGVASPGD